jgi:aryl-alcohol dehydrogenase-like predicted oxidoreductase
LVWLAVRRINEGTSFPEGDIRNTLPRFEADARTANQALVNVVGEIADGRKATRAQIAIAWLLAQKPWIVPIPGTTKLHRLEENAGADGVELTADDLSKIKEALSRIEVVGSRYNAAQQATINR